MPIKPPTFRPPGWTPAPRKRPEAHDPYYGTQAWKRIRAEVLERDGYAGASAQPVKSLLRNTNPTRVLDSSTFGD